MYAETLYQKFGDRVKHWITLNEPHTVAVQGYDAGLFAPGRCSILLHLFCRAGNSATEPYVVAHNLILAHATAVDIYRKKYQVARDLNTRDWVIGVPVFLKSAVLLYISMSRKCNHDHL